MTDSTINYLCKECFQAISWKSYFVIRSMMRFWHINVIEGKTTSRYLENCKKGMEIVERNILSLAKRGIETISVKYQQLIAFEMQFYSTILCFTAFQHIFQPKNDWLCFLLCNFVRTYPSLSKRGIRKRIIFWHIWRKHDGR